MKIRTVIVTLILLKKLYNIILYMANNTINYQSIYSTQIHLNSYNADIFINKTKKSNVVFFFNDTNQASKNVIEMRISVVNAQIPCSGI